MPEREIISKRDMIFAHYTGAFGISHVLTKLGEESCELSKVIYKLLDKQHRKLPIPGELVDSFWEEMAHVILFWGMASDAMGNGNKMQEGVEERLHRFINKITATMEDKKYPARVILENPEMVKDNLEMPYAKNEKGEVVCYLTPFQYAEQLKNPDAKWIAVNGEPAWFDDGYWEEQHS